MIENYEIFHTVKLHPFISYLLPSFLRRHFSVKVSRVMDHFEFVENATRWEHIHFLSKKVTFRTFTESKNLPAIRLIKIATYLVALMIKELQHYGARPYGLNTGLKLTLAHMLACKVRRRRQVKSREQPSVYCYFSVRSAQCYQIRGCESEWLFWLSNLQCGNF